MPEGVLISIDGWPVRNESGELIGSMITFKEITHQERSEAQTIKDKSATHRKPSEAQTIKYKDITLSFKHHRAWRSGCEVKLTRKEFELLAYFLRSRNRLVTRQSLLQQVWRHNPNRLGNAHTIETHLSRLKRKLGKNFAEGLITISGVGYRLE